MRLPGGDDKRCIEFKEVFRRTLYMGQEEFPRSFQEMREIFLAQEPVTIINPCHAP